MKKEIGSIFPLSDEVLHQAESEHVHYSGDRLYYSLCREALFDIAKSISVSNRVVLIPAYTCQTVITPFEEAGWQCEFFSIGKDLRINIQNLQETVERYHPSLLVVHPYYGMDLNNKEIKVLLSIKDKGVEIVLDLTQCLFSTKQYTFASYVVASYRKWMPIPDGSYLVNLSKASKIVQPETENKVFTEREIAAMYLRGQYFEIGEQRTKTISIRISKVADGIAESNIIPHKMSHVAYNLFRNEDLARNQKCRLENYSYLFNKIKETEKVTKVCQTVADVTTAPLYFTIYVQDRSVLQRLLAQDAVYAPLIWPVENENVLINDDVKFIYEHLLAIPCDQRYDVIDMERIVNIINSYQ